MCGGAGWYEEEQVEMCGGAEESLWRGRGKCVEGQGACGGTEVSLWLGRGECVVGRVVYGGAEERLWRGRGEVC